MASTNFQLLFQNYYFFCEEIVSVSQFQSLKYKNYEIHLFFRNNTNEKKKLHPKIKKKHIQNMIFFGITQEKQKKKCCFFF